MNNFFKTFFACLLALVVSSIISFFFTILIFAGLIASIGLQAKEQTTINSGTVLKIDLSTPIVERQSGSLFDNFDIKTFKTNSKVTLYDVLQAVEAAGDDPRIVGIYIDVPMSSPNSASTLWELRQALAKFREKSQKFVVSYSDGYSTGSYYLASVGDCVALNPQGAFTWQGMASTTMFFKGTLDKLGIEAEIFRHGKFKGAVEPFLLDKMSDENRLQMSSLLNSMWGTIVGDVALSREVDSAKLQQYASDLTIAMPRDAKELGLVDELYYKDELIEHLKVLAGSVTEEPNVVSVSEYALVAKAKQKQSSDKVAVVYADGEIADMGDENTEIVGNDLAKTLAKIRQDDDIKAVVLRVNSPGGSALASDIIHREMTLLREQKPVVVSMGSYAASGGYYISCAADKIVTTPVTLTGSIGVFGMLFNAQKGAHDFLGINVDVVGTNPSADLGNMFRPMSSAERQFIQNGVDSTYVRFAGLVAQGRDMPYAQVDSIAQGRIWSGVQAVDNHLADEIGGLSYSIARAAELAGLEAYNVSNYPKVDASFGALFSELSGAGVKFIFGSSVGDIAERQAQMLQRISSRQGIQARMEYDVEIKN